MKYKSWRGIEGLTKALNIQDELWNELGKKPSRKDFIVAGYYNAYMALYRARRSGMTIKDPHTKLTEITNLVFAIDDLSLIEKIFELCIHKLTPSHAQDILNKITRKFN